MKFPRCARALIPALVVTILASCGGGGGGGGGAPGQINDETDTGNGGSGTPPGEDTVGIPPESIGACASNLEDVMDALGNGSSLTLPNISAGCDYLVDGSTTISNDVRVEAGVTFALTSGTVLEFSAEDTRLTGTANAPIRFQPQAASEAWGYVYFSREGASIEHTLFAGGGVSNGPRGAEPAMVFANGRGTTITDSSFTDSVSMGLALSDPSARGEELNFRRNKFSGNADTGLLVGSRLLSFLDRDSDYAGRERANGVIGLRVEGVGIYDQIVKHVNTPYLLERPSASFSSNEVSVNGSLFEPGVQVVVPDNIDLDLIDTVINGTSENPVQLVAQAGSVSGWGTLILERNSQIRNVVISDGGSTQSEAGAALSVQPSSTSNLENINIVNSRSWGVICRSTFSTSQGTSVNIAGLQFSGSALGDVHPNCELNELPAIVDGQRRDPSECAEVVIADIDAERAVFSNTDAACDFYIVGDVVLSGSSNAVTIAPGTSFLFARDASLTINGTLIANGTADGVISMQGEVASDGFWAGVQVNGKSFQISHLTMEDGGLADGAGLTLARADRTPLDEEISASVSRLEVSGSAGDGFEIGSRVTLTEFADNSFYGNAQFGLRLPIDQVSALDSNTLYDSAMAANGFPGIRLRNTFVDGIYLQEGQYTLSDLGAPWYSPSLQLTAARDESVQLTLNAGTQLYFDEDASLDISGSFQQFLTPALTINGTAENPVRISGPIDSPADWLGIDVGQMDASYVTITGGGFDSEDTGNSGGGSVTLNRGADVKLDNVTIQDSRGWGIHCETSSIESLMPSNMSYSGNTLGNINPDCGS